MYDEHGSGSFISDDGITTKQGKLIAIFKVSTEVLRRTDTFFKSLVSSTWLRPGQLGIDFGEKRTSVVKIWFQILHDTVDYESYKASIEDIYDAIGISKKYILEMEKLNCWFKKWAFVNGGLRMRRFDHKELQQLLFLCYELEHVQGFADATRRLAYEFRGHINGFNPSKYEELHLHPRILSKSLIRNLVMKSPFPFQ